MRARDWLDAARPKTLVVSVAPVLLGASLAVEAGRHRPLATVAALAAALLLQIGANLANDLFDAARGADGPDRLGPPRAVASGRLSARAVGVATAAVLLAAVLVGAYLVWLAGPPILLLGLASVAAGLAYTAGPWPLAYHGLGDVFVFLFFGVAAVTGTHYVSTGAPSPLALAWSVPVGALATAVLVVNNLRDAKSDARANKRTLVVRFGERFGRLEYAALVGLAFATPLLFALGGERRALLPLLALPLGLSAVREVLRREGRALEPLLGRTAGLLLSFSALASLQAVLP